MKKNLKKITLGIATAVLAAAVFAGCGDSAATEEETLARSTTTAAAEENSTAEGDADAADQAEEVSETAAQDDGSEETTLTLEGENGGSGEEQTTEAAAQEAELTCALLYEAAAEQAADGAGELTGRDTCTFVSKDYRDSLEDFYYAADSEQVYCVCVVKAESEAIAAEILQEFNDTLESVQNDTYLTTDQQKVVKTAVTGSSGSYIWYLSLSEDSDVVKAAENALKDRLDSFQ